MQQVSHKASFGCILETLLWKVFPQSLWNTLMLQQKVPLPALLELYSQKAGCWRFPTSLVGLAYNSKSCVQKGPEGARGGQRRPEEARGGQMGAYR